MISRVVVAICLLIGVLPAAKANAGDAGNIFNIFTNIMRSAVVDHTRKEWSRIPEAEASCIEQALEDRGNSIDALVQRGVSPNDRSLSGVRADCRNTAMNSPDQTADVEEHRLSEKPTFDCTKARSATGRIICLDQEGASADWGLISASWALRFSLPESQRSSFDRGEERWFPAVKQTCRVSDQQETFSSSQRRCVLNAYKNLARNYRARLKGDALAESMLTPEAHAELQQALISRGFLSDMADGEFGQDTRAAIRRFQASSGFPQSDFLTVTERQALLKSQASTPSKAVCSVVDPTDTPLNVRTSPDGEIIKTVQNGSLVSVLQTRREAGKDWALIAEGTSDQSVGWVFHDYINCAATTPDSPVKQVASPAPQIETPKLKEAKIFLSDAKAFIAEQKNNQVSNVAEIAVEAANLQTALASFDEAKAVQSMQNLDRLLTSANGFTDFQQHAAEARKKEEGAQLAEAKAESRKNLLFIDSFMKSHLGDEKTTALLEFRQRLDGSTNTDTAQELQKVNSEFASYVSKNGLTQSYQQAMLALDVNSNSRAQKTKQLIDQLSIGKAQSVFQGADDDILLFYNVSATAPHVWRNVRGDVVFQSDTGNLCFAQQNAEIGLVRYIEGQLRDQGAKALTTAPDACDLSNASQSTDVIAMQRSAFLRSPDDYLENFSKLIEKDVFKSYRVITDYASYVQKRKSLASEVQRGVENESRRGYGVIKVGDSSAMCIALKTPSDAHAQSADVVVFPNNDPREGLEALLQQNRYAIAPSLTSNWQFVVTSIDDALLRLQRNQCSFVSASTADLHLISDALRRDAVQKFSYAAVWLNNEDVDHASFDLRDAKEQQMRKEAERKRAEKERETLELEREKNKQAQKTEIEKQLREAHGDRAQGLTRKVGDFAQDVAKNREPKNNFEFPTYTSWLGGRALESWETYNVNSETSDFGTVNWNGRKLDAILAKSIVQQKNRKIGKYEDTCFEFGLVDDPSFDMSRDLISTKCNDASTIDTWKRSMSFQSEWNAD